MDRRQFLEVGGTCAVGLPLGAPLVWTDSSTEKPALVRPDMLARIGDQDLIPHLGHQYRRAVPEEDRASRIVETLKREARGQPGTDLAARLQARIRQDFAEGRTVTVDGWILARTEARQCALYSLHHA